MTYRCIVFFLFVSIFLSPVCEGQAHTYRFEDEKRNVYLVDSMEKVPERYRLSAERIPESPDLAVIGNALQAPMVSGDGAVIRKLLFSYVYRDPVLITFGVVAVLLAVLILLVKSRLNRLTLYLLLLVSVLLLHTTMVVPCIQKNMFVFGHAAISMTPASRRSATLPYRIALDAYVTRPASLKPWDIHLKLRTLASDTVTLVQP